MSGADREARIEQMERLERADLLAELIEKAPSPKDAKMLRRALHRLRSRGVMIESGAPQRKYIMPKRETQKDEAYVSPVGPAGDQVVWLFSVKGGSGILFNAVVDDIKGLIDFIAAKATRSKFEKVMKRTMETAKELPIIRVAPEHALFLISRAEETAHRTGARPPEAFMESRRLLGELPPPDVKHPLEQMLDYAAIGEQKGLVYDSERLLEHPFFKGWLFSRSSVEICKQKLEQAEASPIMMNEAQKKERFERIFAEEAMNAVENEGRGLFKARLIENAYLLLQNQERGNAETALATALALDQDTAQPFFTQMMKLSFSSPKKTSEPDKGSIIIT